MLGVLAPNMGFISHSSGMLVPVMLLLSMTSSAGAIDIVTEDAALLKSGWIEYSSSSNRLPQCCTSDSCRMVRISPTLLNHVKTSPKMRVTMTGKNNSMSIIVTYDSQLEGLEGLVYRRNGILHFLKPLSMEERRKEPCYVSRIASHMGTFHKINLQRTDAGMPKFLFNPSLTQHTNPETCCPGNTCNQVRKINSEILKFDPEHSPNIYIPRHTLPSEDLSEVFTMSSTQPSSCKTSLCDIYLYHNFQKELLKISVTDDFITAHLETEGANPDMVLKQCSGKYVWTEKQKKKTSQKGYISAQDILPTVFGSTAVRAVPGPTCWNPQDYCDPLHHVISYSSDQEGVKDREELVLQCYQACYDLVECSHFTYFSMRKKGTCYLLSDCKSTFDTCLKIGTCVSGPSDCDPTPSNGNCAPPLDLGDGYNKWQCIDKETRKIGSVHLNTTLPPGTLCLQSCGAWRTEAKPDKPQTTGYLESRCGNSGQWSETVPFNGDTNLEFPSGPYPAPDATTNASIKPLSCGCEPLLLDYNPNHEDGAEFPCKRNVSWDGYQFTITTGNECHLWCDGVLVISVKCSEDGWTGEPKKEGIWCYTKPETAIGPRNAKYPCDPNPCGPNSGRPQQIGKRCQCSCLPGMISSPPNCRPECGINSDCEKELACISQKCQDPCPGLCGINAYCSVRNHVPICACKKGYAGDPFRQCRRITEDPCDPNPCGPNSVKPQQIGGKCKCSCLPEMIGSPPNCRPECVINSDCSQELACISQKCQDPCPGLCGYNARCRVRNHASICVCYKGYTGDPFRHCRRITTTSTRPEIIEPCQPSPCGINAECRERNGAATCTCLSGLGGNPYIECKPECTINQECPSKLACLGNKCKDPCPGVCGVHASCSVNNHIPSCQCDPGYTGDPFNSCYFDTTPPSQITDKQDPCNPSPCGSNAVCQNKKSAATCQCIPEYFGDPYVACQPKCLFNSDCPSNKACLNNKCVDPCPGTCGLNAVCSVTNHIPTCVCNTGYIGDPFTSCRLKPLPIAPV